MRTYLLPAVENAISVINSYKKTYLTANDKKNFQNEAEISSYCIIKLQHSTKTTIDSYPLDIKLCLHFGFISLPIL